VYTVDITNSASNVQGFLNLNKPSGMTSHDCVGRVRRLLHLKRIGHGGTLDPMATGVLPIAIGTATRLLQFLAPEKTYQATIRFGLQTTTDDVTGEAIATAPVPHLTLEIVEAALPKFQGKILQIPPQFSAIQIQGQRLYDLARRGEVIDVPARWVDVFYLKPLAWRAGDFPELDVEIACGTGTYIRAIARDLGTLLGTGGTLAALVRTANCGFHLSESLNFEALETATQADQFTPIPPSHALQHLPALELDSESARRWCCGQKLPFPISTAPTQTTETEQIFRVTDPAGQLLGVGQSLEGLLLARVVLTPN
jgi:tRNA pseudouridine55 synthase